MIILILIKISIVESLHYFKTSGHLFMFVRLLNFVNIIYYMSTPYETTFSLY